MASWNTTATLMYVLLGTVAASAQADAPASGLAVHRAIVPGTPQSMNVTTVYDPIFKNGFEDPCSEDADSDDEHGRIV